MFELKKQSNFHQPRASQARDASFPVTTMLIYATSCRKIYLSKDFFFSTWLQWSFALTDFVLSARLLVIQIKDSTAQTTNALLK